MQSLCNFKRGCDAMRCNCLSMFFAINRKTCFCFVWERDFSDVKKYVHNKQVISPIQLSEVDSSFIICLFRKHSPYKNCANYA